MTNLVNEFDEKAKTWDDDPVKIERSKIVAHAILKEIGDGSNLKAFEYGCGTGLVSFFLQPHFKSILMADSSKGMLAVAAVKITAAAVKNMSLREVDLSQGNPINDRFDCIYTMLTLHHMQDIPGTLNHFYAMAQNEGYLFVIDLDREDGSFHGAGFRGHNGFNRESLQNDAAKAGFSDVAFRTVFSITKKKENGETVVYPLFMMCCRKRPLALASKPI